VSASWAGGSTRTWRKLRMYVLNRDGFACQVLTRSGEACGAWATHVDHIVPLSKGGPKYDDRNCRAACSSCNLRLGARSTTPDDAPRTKTLSQAGRDWSW
jgi:5-methylcytosine-specific restriction endonuclease McrA